MNNVFKVFKRLNSNTTDEAIFTGGRILTHRKLEIPFVNADAKAPTVSDVLFRNIPSIKQRLRIFHLFKTLQLPKLDKVVITSLKSSKEQLPFDETHFVKVITRHGSSGLYGIRKSQAHFETDCHFVIPVSLRNSLSGNLVKFLEKNHCFHEHEDGFIFEVKKFPIRELNLKYGFDLLKGVIIK